MNAHRNWGLIRSGATFEALATTLISFSDPRAVLFGRRGLDGGQDARSGDGTIVYQAKHHENASAAKAIADAIREAGKIREYREAGHARSEQWRGVTHWCLVTNAEFNPTTHARWIEEVVPLFAAVGLSASYWERANLDVLLDTHPEVSRSFFENSTRALLSLPEVRTRLSEDEPFLQRELGRFVGRTDDVAAVARFASTNALFLVLHGPGGVGKTRLLVEAGEAIAATGQWQVLWANTATMSRSDTWFIGVVPERPTLLLVDEPEDESILQLLAEQLGSGRTSQWKVVVAVRSPKDPVLRFLNSARMKQRCLVHEVLALSQSVAAEMCVGLLQAGPLGSRPPEQLQRLAADLAGNFATFPIWLTLAVHLLETRGDLSLVPRTAESLAAEYLAEIITQQQEFAPERLTLLLRWIALLAPFARDELATVDLVATELGVDRNGVLAAITRLVSRRAVTERGANRRLVEIKPDVLRDQVLLTWLSVASGPTDGSRAPSDAVTRLAAPIAEAVLQGGLNSVGKKILVALARTEMLLRLSGTEVDILHSFFEPLRLGLTSTNARGLIAIAEVLQEIAYVRPADVVEMSRLLRSVPVEDQELEEFLGKPHRLGRDDVVLALGSSVYQAALGANSIEARRSVLRELCTLCELEAGVATRRQRLPNDGKRAAQLVDQAIQGGPGFWSDFEDVGEELAGEFITEAARTPPSSGRSAAITALIHGVLGIEREHISSEGHSFTIRRYLVAPTDLAWESRGRVKAKIRSAVEDDSVPSPTRQLYWHLLAESHRSLTQVGRMTSQQIGPEYRAEAVDDLLWAERTLQARAPSLEELANSRKLWDWHRRFDSDEELKATAERLEIFYTRDSLAAEFDPLVSWDDIDEKGLRTTAKAVQLAAEADAEAIAEFVRRAQRFLGADVTRLQGIAWELGRQAASSPSARAFARFGLGSSDPGQQYFARVVGRSWVFLLRETSPEEVVPVIRELTGACVNEALQAQFLEDIFAPPHRIWKLTLEEHQYLRDQADLFVRAGYGPGFLHAAAWALDIEWPRLRALLERVIASLSGDATDKGLDALIESLFWATRPDTPILGVPTELGAWMLDQLTVVSDIDQLGDSVEWRIQEIFKRVQRPHLPWLVIALKKRRALEKQEGQVGERFRAVSTHARLSAFVEEVKAADVADESMRVAVRELVELVHDQSSIGYYAPKLLVDVDPTGLIVPVVVAEAIVAAQDNQHLLRLARVGGAYAIGSAAWRVVAKGALLSTAGTADRNALFSALRGSRSQMWHGTPGEVPPIFVSAVEGAKRQAAQETDAVFAPFWAWQLAIAEYDLKREQEDAREERGE